MNRSAVISRSRVSIPGFPVKSVLAFLVALLLLLYYTSQQAEIVYATATGPSGMMFSYEVIESEMTVDWNNGGDFDPKDKCPKDFLSEGFVVICKKLRDGGFFKYLYHQGKHLLYRIDEDIILGKAVIGLHWVVGTHFNAKYRVADPAYKGGKALSVPNAKGGMDQVEFQYGEAVSKKRVQHGRELFSQTHIQPEQCPEWWDIFNFVP